MIYPSVDKLLEKVDSKYSLVIAAAKRARVLKEGTPLLLKETNSNKYVGKALEEIGADEIVIQNK